MCAVDGGIVILKNTVIGREMSGDYWPKMIIKNLNIFLRIDISIYLRYRTDAMNTNTPQYHNFYWALLASFHKDRSPTFFLLLPNINTMILSKTNLTFVRKIDIPSKVFYSPPSLTPAPVNPLPPVPHLDDNLLLINNLPITRKLLSPSHRLSPRTHFQIPYLIKSSRNFLQRSLSVTVYKPP